MIPRAFLVVAALCGCLTVSLAAQRPGTVEFSALGIWHNKTTVHDGLRAFGIGGRFGVWLPAGFGLEGQLDWSHPSNTMVPTSYSLVHLGVGALYNYVFPTGSSLYARAGYGRLNPKAPCTVVEVACSAFSALNFGAGFRVPLARAVQFRMEGMVRTRSTYHYTSVGVSAGLTLLGASRSAGPGGMADDDLDGVPNNRDRCRATARGALVDTRGCPTDLDGDGVSDGLDRCPATPKGTQVDPFGCPIKRPE
jgi:hypothetical protein